MKKNKIIIISLITVLLIGGGIYYYSTKMKGNNNNPINKIIKELKEEPKVKIVDLESNSRTYAVSIDNVRSARPQSGVQSAYIVYEFIVEGGLTRLLALFRDVDLEAIGPVRSARHYFLDYALENDAMFVHCGYSPQAKSDISKLRINNLFLEGNVTASYRNKNKRAPHNLYTSSELLAQGATKKKYRTTSTNDLLLDYSAKDVELKDSIVATKIDISYSKSITINYEYDETKKVYLRSMNNTPHIDELTGNQLEVTNIITYKTENDTITSDYKGRQELNNIGSGEGYYITRGQAIKITWSKSSRSAGTIYKTIDGKELVVNDGNTFIQIEPASRELIIS